MSAIAAARSTERGEDVGVRSATRVVALTSSLLTQRMLLHANPPLASAPTLSVRVWSTSASCDSLEQGGPEPFPAVRPFCEFPHNYLRRLNDYTWDARRRSATRDSIWRHVRQGRVSPFVQMLHWPAFVLGRLGLERIVERWLEAFLVRYERSVEATERLRQFRPQLLLSTGPHRYEEPAVVASAKRLGIPTLALITSWDNITTKNRMPFRCDGYLVWSDHMKRELHEYYPASRACPTYVVGAPQFDAFFQKRYWEPRSAFCSRVGLNPAKPIILYALGSPNLLKEHHGAAFLAERLCRGDLGDVQMLVRPHPIFDEASELRRLESFGGAVRVQRTGRPGVPTAKRSQSVTEVADWVNTFRHADVVVNLSSTATVDAALCDRPVVNLDYDPEPGRPNQSLVRDINHTWQHFKPVAESGGVWLVDSPADMVHAVRSYLARPALHRDRRRWIAQYVCGFTDGRSGERIIGAVTDFLSRTSSARQDRP